MPHAVPARPKASRLFIGGAFALLAVIGLCILGAGGYASSTRLVEHTLHVQAELDTWTTMVLGLQNEMRGYVASGRADFVADFPQQRALARKQVARLRELVADNRSQTTALDRADRASEDAIAHFEAQQERIRSGQHAQAITLMADGIGQRHMDRFREHAARIGAEEEKLLLERRAEATERAWLTLAGALTVAMVAYALLAFAWRREVAHEAAVAALARSARQRLALLAKLAGGLSNARTASDVAEVVVEQGLAAARGDTCTLYALDPDGKALRLLGQRGVAPDILDGLRVIDAESATPQILESAKESRSVWAENETDYARIYPRLAAAKVTGRRAKAFWSVPLEAEGRVLGMLGVGFYEARRFSDDERAFVDTLARQCAQALLRATRREAEEEARQWFSTTLRSIGDAVIATDRHGRVTFLNPVAERLTGWSERDALGQPLEAVFDILSEQTRKPVENPVSKVLREGKIVGLANHTLLKPRNGPELPIDDSGAPIRNEANEIVGVVLVFRDVSREKRQEGRNAFLAKAGEVLASSLDYQTTLGVVARLAVPQLADWCAIDLVDPDNGRIRQVAVAHADLEKVRLAEDLGRRYPPAADAERGAPQVIRSGKSELYADIPAPMLKAAARNEEHLQLLEALDLRSAVVVPLIGQGRTLGAMTFVYAASDRRYDAADLAFVEEVARRAGMAIENSSALKQAESAHQRERWLRAEAERANRLKDEFLATVSHELRTPLNAILGWTLTLRRGSLEVQVDRGLAIVERNARAQARLIDDVLDVSRIVSGKLILRLGPTNVGQAARAAVESVLPAAEAKAIAITLDIPDDGTLISADPGRLQQVVWNLLSNAVKFTPKSGRILLRVFREESDVALSVTDTGEGIAPEHLGAVFEPFQQADASTTRRHGGLGLGLAIVKQLVEAHGGSVSAGSEGLGHGATFSVRLPVRAVAPSAEPQRAMVSAPHDPLVASSTGARLDGLRVLVVDDEPDARLLVQEILHLHGAVVFLASSAEEARAKLADASPDVIVSDIGMPGEDGYSFIRHVRADGGRTPAVALTAYASQQDAERAFVAGFQKHVIKPVEPAQLVSVVANLGGRSL